MKSGKEIILEIFNETVEMLRMNDFELRDYLAKRFHDNHIYHYSEIELKTCLNGVIEGRKNFIKSVLNIIEN